MGLSAGKNKAINHDGIHFSNLVLEKTLGKIDRSALAPIASQMMGAALAKLARDGYVAFATVVIGKDKTITPILMQSNNSSEREAFGDVSGALSLHVASIISLL